MQAYQEPQIKFVCFAADVLTVEGARETGTAVYGWTNGNFGVIN